MIYPEPVFEKYRKFCDIPKSLSEIKQFTGGKQVKRILSLLAAMITAHGFLLKQQGNLYGSSDNMHNNGFINAKDALEILIRSLA